MYACSVSQILILRSFCLQQGFEGGDELQVGGWGDVVVTLQLSHEARRQLNGWSMEALAHVDAALSGLICHLHIL